MNQTVKFFRLKEEANEKLEIEVEKIMEELNEFFGVNWTENVPTVYFLNSRKQINDIRQVDQPWVVGWSDARNIFLLDQDKFETESNHKKIGDKEYRALIKHEFCHAYETASSYLWRPRWLSEGLSHYVSGQLEFEKEPKIFKHFLNFFEKVGPEVHWESGWIIKILVDNFGKEKLIKLFEETKEAKPSEEEFKKIFLGVYGFELNYESFNKYLEPLDVSSLPYRKNIGCVVFKDDKFLLLHKPDWPENHWKFPQGGIDKNESDEETAKRELLEELGTDKFKIIGKSKHERQYDWSDDAIEKAGYRWKGQNQKFFVVEFLGSENDIKLNSEEIGKYKWVMKDELLSIIDIDHKNFTGYKDSIGKILEEFKSHLK